MKSHLFSTLKNCWALLFGIGVIMLGHSLQGTLLGVRATSEGFTPLVTGIVMSGYYIGIIVGSRITPTMISHVGHVRVFAALASVVSAVALLHSLYVTAGGWLMMRVMTGIGLSGLYIVVESWLNEQAGNQERGKILSIYMVISVGCMASGPLLMNIANPDSFELFILVSVLFSLALIPILLTISPIPAFETSRAIRILELYRAAPLGVIGSFATGFSTGSLMGVGAVCAKNAGLSVPEISLFMSAALWGGAICQWPVGVLSDRFDRRFVMTAVTFLAGAVSLVCVAVVSGNGLKTYVLIGLFGGLTLPMYSLNLAFINDHLQPEQMVAASSTMILVNGLGAVSGPVFSGGAMSIMGPMGMFVVLSTVHISLGLFALYRMRRRAPVPIDKQSPAIHVPRTSPVAAAAFFEKETGIRNYRSKEAE
ncbi:MAG: MFS transporter [Deltaproteobacteria bacterium]|nr:MFS transporter [Deltaproteobacteria bacterium]